MPIVTHPQATINTYVTDSTGQRRAAVVTSKQMIFNKTRDFQWHPVSEFTRRISRSGLRGRIAELESEGFRFNRRVDNNGRLVSIRLNTVPGVGSFLSEPLVQTV